VGFHVTYYRCRYRRRRNWSAWSHRAAVSKITCAHEVTDVPMTSQNIDPSLTQYSYSYDVRSNSTSCSATYLYSTIPLTYDKHLASEEDHHRVVAAALRPPADWKRPFGRPRTTWLRTTDDDLQSLNFGVHSPQGLGEGTFGIKSSVRQRSTASTEEFATKEEYPLQADTRPRNLYVGLTNLHASVTWFLV